MQEKINVKSASISNTESNKWLERASIMWVLASVVQRWDRV